MEIMIKRASEGGGLLGAGNFFILVVSGVNLLFDISSS